MFPRLSQKAGLQEEAESLVEEMLLIHVYGNELLHT